jgi:hypothetical protein
MNSQTNEKVNGVVYLFKNGGSTNFCWILCNMELIPKKCNLHDYHQLNVSSRYKFSFNLFNWTTLWDSICNFIQELYFNKNWKHKETSNTSRMSNILVIWAKRSTRWPSARRRRNSISKVWSFPESCHQAY